MRKRGIRPLKFNLLLHLLSINLRETVENMGNTECTVYTCHCQYTRGNDLQIQREVWRHDHGPTSSLPDMAIWVDRSDGGRDGWLAR